MGMLQTLWRHSRLLIGQGFECRTLLVGAARGAAAELRAAYLGSGQTLPFILRELFESPQRITAASLDEVPAVDLCIEERPPLASLVNAPAHELRLPTWISQQIDLRPAGAEGFAFSRHVRRETERHIRRCGYSLDFSNDPQALRQFYRDMYRPYVQARFDAQAIVVSEETFLQRAAGQWLARLHAGATWTAGMLLAREAQTLRFGWFGARSNPPPPGASEVLDALVIRWAVQQKLQRVVLGHSRACLRDGVLRYKRRLGAQIRATRFPQPQIFLRMVRPSEWLARCLDEAGFIRVRGDAAFVQRVEIRDGKPEVRLEPVTHERP